MFRFSPMKVGCFVVLIGVMAGNAHGQNGMPGKSQINRDADALVTRLCAGCHTQQEPVSDDVPPRLDGQNRYYLEKQLKNFMDGSRKSEIMQPIVSQITENDVGLLALYYSEARHVPAAPMEHKPDPRANGIFQEGIADRGLRACTACHGGWAEGLLEMPKLAGQNEQYVMKQLRSFKSGERTNDGGGIMRAIATKLTDADIAVLGGYLNGLR